MAEGPTQAQVERTIHAQHVRRTLDSVGPKYAVESIVNHARALFAALVDELDYRCSLRSGSLFADPETKTALVSARELVRVIDAYKGDGLRGIEETIARQGVRLDSHLQRLDELAEKLAALEKKSDERATLIGDDLDGLKALVQNLTPPAAVQA